MTVKISELPAAGTLTGAELVPLVIGGVTSQSTPAAWPYKSSVSGSTTRTAYSKAGEVLSVKDFGATGDGVTDDATAIQAAITAAIALNAPVELFFPYGTYLISTVITCDPTLQASSKVMLRGTGPYTSVIKAKTGFTSTKMLHMGAAGTVTRMEGSGICDLGFNGNSLPAASGNAGVYIYNAYRCVFLNLAVDNFAGGGDGLASYGNVAGVAGDPCNQGNVFTNIYTRGCGGAGQYYRGEKSSMFDQLQSDANTVQGVFFDSESITAGSTETTECVIGSILVKNNTGAGVAFSGIAKYSIANIEAYINGSVGVLFSDTRSGTTVGNFYSSIGTIVSRNNAGALANATGTNGNYCQGVYIGSVVHVGGKGLGVSETEAAAVVIAGWSACTIGIINSQLNIGTCIRVLDQTGARASSTITFDTVMLISNGSTNATTNHGISLEDNSALITINKLHSANSYTTAAKSSYELKTSAATTAVINNMYVYAGQAGQEVSIGNQSLVSFGNTSSIRGLAAERKITGLAAASTITAYGSYANEFWDNSSAVRKYTRMGDSTLRVVSGESSTFTPSITFATVGDLAVTYTTQTGRYQVSGNRCFFDIVLLTSAFTYTTSAGAFRLAGFPFSGAAASGTNYSSVGYFRGFTLAAYTSLSFAKNAADTIGTFYLSEQGAVPTQATVTHVTSGSTVDIRFQGWYEVDLPLA